ncbi:angiotensin-converting enzyme isoform X1 [Bombyx mori]|uniref:Angiotensin-converting enzyme n=2 Tax=Bombyx mori TaxID=7091 RepID=A0A8R1WML3_BOMMO|nr:angiotensin-converting enzyme isoform X1 [Bombyx mori]
MIVARFICLVGIISTAVSVQFQTNPSSDMSADETSTPKNNKTLDVSDESGHELEADVDDIKEKKFLDEAIKAILDPHAFIPKNQDELESYKLQLDELNKSNISLDSFLSEMDNLSLEVCKTSQKALWSYVSDINNETKKNKMVRITAEEDEIKKQYWNILKTKYLRDDTVKNDRNYQRKIRIIKERGTNVQMPQSKQREEIDLMQRIWSRVSLCAYNTSCNNEDSIRSMSDVIAIFKTSNDSKELAYYWKAFRDMTGRKIRPIFKDYVTRMNAVAKSENFSDAGEMWRLSYDDNNFVETVKTIWNEMKPLYNLIRDYVRLKLKSYYPEDIKSDTNCIPAHLLGNLWAQEWQAIYPKVIAYPKHYRHKTFTQGLKSKDLFDAVDLFHQSLGFDSANDSYKDISDGVPSANCLPSSHDMCDGVNYKIKWCGDKITDVEVALSQAARLLGHVQYFKHYKDLSPLYRDGPNPAFHDAISDIVAVQLTLPDHLKTLNLVKASTGREVTINHLLWLALEKIPLMAYAYVLDTWRWDIFGNSSLENWNAHWWDLRTKETGVSPPVLRNESDLDPAAKYHVVSHVQYITYLISHVLEFQILFSLCKKVNHTGPLHECSLYGHKEVGKLLSNGMALGASEDWNTVLETMTGERQLSTEGILEYFSILEDFLRKENLRLAAVVEDMDKSAPIVVGAIVVFLTVLIIVLYCAKKHDLGRKMRSFCGLTKNGSLDIVTNEVPQSKTNDIEGIVEDKV